VSGSHGSQLFHRLDLNGFPLEDVGYLAHLTHGSRSGCMVHRFLHDETASKLK